MACNVDPMKSAIGCGCDPGAEHVCERHRNNGEAQQMASTEVRVVDTVTGGEKGSKLARFDLIPPEALWALAEVYGRGARKYADRNWERGYAWGLSIAALERHLSLWKSGETFDNGEGGTGAHHLSQVAWHAFTLFTFQLFGLGTDDRSTMVADSRTVESEKEPEEQRYTCPRDGQENCCGETGYVTCCKLCAEDLTYRIVVEKERY